MARLPLFGYILKPDSGNNFRQIWVKGMTKRETQWDSCQSTCLLVFSGWISTCPTSEHF